MSSTGVCFLSCFRYIFTLGFFSVLNKATSHSFIYSLVCKFTVLRIKPRVLCLQSNPSTPGLFPWPDTLTVTSPPSLLSLSYKLSDIFKTCYQGFFIPSQWISLDLSLAHIRRDDICLVSFCKPSRLRFHRTHLLSSTRYTRGTSDQPVLWVCLTDTNVYVLSILNSFHPPWLSGQGMLGASTVKRLATDNGCCKCCDCHVMLCSLLRANACVTRMTVLPRCWCSWINLRGFFWACRSYYIAVLFFLRIF